MSKKVYIGVGHGGSDPGAVGFLIEKDVNLKMALACRNFLKANAVDTKISRETDKDVSVDTKVKEANAWGADLALDFHNNGGKGNGAEVYHSICYGKGKELSDNILEELKKIGQNSRGSKTKKGTNGDYFGFIRNTSMPAVITEAVFVDNQSDAAQADTDAECVMFGEAIAKGILKTLGMGYSEKVEHSIEIEQPKLINDKHFMIKVTTNALNIRSDAGINNKVVGVIRDRGVYTIVETKTVGGYEWGKLKSGAGWICLEYTEKV